ncbi:PH domain-containing protein [Haloimpatiens sp. FM7330]|uniref:PH domain-containing protein n=1 Tax=Haloimpatiens sp. FM7330 TaxID=3298610 RepID=UPI003634B82D
MEYSRINKNAVKAWFIGRIIFLVIFSGIYLAIGYKFLIPKFGESITFKYVFGILSFLILGFFCVNTFIFPKIEYRQWRYLITEDKIELINGIIIRSKIIIPISRIQHLDIEQGPIYRKFGLACLKLNTAGASHEIPALTIDEAEELSEKLKQIVEMSDKIE